MLVDYWEKGTRIFLKGAAVSALKDILRSERVFLTVWIYTTFCLLKAQNKKRSIMVVKQLVYSHRDRPFCVDLLPLIVIDKPGFPNGLWSPREIASLCTTAPTTEPSRVLLNECVLSLTEVWAQVLHSVHINTQIYSEQYKYQENSFCTLWDDTIQMYFFPVVLAMRWGGEMH